MGIFGRSRIGFQSKTSATRRAAPYFRRALRVVLGGLRLPVPGRSVRRRNFHDFQEHFYSAGERRGLVWCCLAAVVSVVVAVAWPNWITVHCAAILSGLVLALALAPWVDDQQVGDHKIGDPALAPQRPDTGGTVESASRGPQAPPRRAA